MTVNASVVCLLGVFIICVDKLSVVSKESKMFSEVSIILLGGEFCMFGIEFCLYVCMELYL